MKEYPSRGTIPETKKERAMTNQILARGEVVQALHSDGLAFRWFLDSMQQDGDSLQCRVNCMLSADTVLYLVFRIRTATEIAELDQLDFAKCDRRISREIREEVINEIGEAIDGTVGYFPLSQIVSKLRTIEDNIVTVFKVIPQAKKYVFPKDFPPPFGSSKSVKSYVTAPAAVAGALAVSKEEKGSLMSTLHDNILPLVKQGGKTAAGSVVADKIRDILVRKLEGTPLEGFAFCLPDEVCSFVLALSVFYVAEYVPGVPKAESVQAAAELAIQGTAHDAWKTLFDQVADIFGEIAEEVTGVMRAAEE